MSTTIKKRIKPKHPYIERRQGVCGGEPVIAGTRISVGLIVEMDMAGHSFVVYLNRFYRWHGQTPFVRAELDVSHGVFT